MRHYVLFVIGGLLIGIWGTGCFRPTARAVNQVCFQGQCIAVEVVQKEEELRRGLQFRSFLESDAGMLFIFAANWKHSFWMKDTLIPLDIIWMDYARRVVHIERSVPPCPGEPCPTYTPLYDALYVLEINAGQARALGLRIGDQAEFKLK
ncbi:MAG: hypothetical protein A3G91_04245 [Omnitrophica WOR_2 bacterium RIFCSPLOWO2_12_FULL_50_9]|nr:MAG: hypothetical protein A3D87_04860 [Omnitrophica WOR_2 bacterium RIFCSPHIGHO2_02_FULL_50_17]OGX43259.1 MAG: hypothetical protein A3G91_04245 [Omnitrophica WOR_2 bacterium RIFCSPLOWO2_12_FULL_50_9]